MIAEHHIRPVESNVCRRTRFPAGFQQHTSLESITAKLQLPWFGIAKSERLAQKCQSVYYEHYYKVDLSSRGKNH